ncbi:MAG: hypothetical protein ACREMU_03805, partial [Gemmatimonadaceae bacterium]
LAPSKPTPVTDLLIAITRPLTPGATYRLDARDMHNLMGIAATSTRTFSVPKPAPPNPKDSTHTAPGAHLRPPPAKRDTTHTQPPA